MKRIFAAALFSIATLSADDANKVTIDLSKLPESAQKQVRDAAALEHKVSDVGWAAGLGHELGTAVNESLLAVSSNAQQLANSNLGHFILFAIAFKLFGPMLIHVSVGTFLLLMAWAILLWSYRRTCLPYSVKKQVRKENGATVIEYEVFPGPSLERKSGQELSSAAGYRLAHALVFAACTFVGVVTIFTW